MSRHLNNLQRLWSKLQRRYGNDDAFVLEVKREIDALEAGANIRTSTSRDKFPCGAQTLTMHKTDERLAVQ